MHRPNRPTLTSLPDDVLSMPAHFDFAAARQFLGKINAIPDSDWPFYITLDFSRTKYIDTAGLGVLLLFGERFGAKRTIRFHGATGLVRECLEIARIEERLSHWNAKAEAYDLRACTRCGNLACKACDGTLDSAAVCPRAQKSAAMADQLAA